MTPKEYRTTIGLGELLWRVPCSFCFLYRIRFYGFMIQHVTPLYAMVMPPEIMEQYLNGFLRTVYELTKEGVEKHYLDPSQLDTWENRR